MSGIKTEYLANGRVVEGELLRKIRMPVLPIDVQQKLLAMSPSDQARFLYKTICDAVRELPNNNSQSRAASESVNLQDI